MILGEVVAVLKNFVRARGRERNSHFQTVISNCMYYRLCRLLMEPPSRERKQLLAHLCYLSPKAISKLLRESR